VVTANSSTDAAGIGETQKAAGSIRRRTRHPSPAGELPFFH